MVPLMEGIGKLYGSLGFAAVHNGTKRPFLTSDNPVLWFDPSVPFDAQRPYTVNLDGGPIFLAFPLSPVLVLVGSTDYKEVFGQQGLLHTEVPDEHWVELINAHICRFAYEAVIARSRGQEEIIAKYAGISPVHEAVPLHVGKGTAIIHRQVFGPRVAKAKWRDE